METWRLHISTFIAMIMFILAFQHLQVVAINMPRKTRGSHFLAKVVHSIMHELFNPPASQCLLGFWIKYKPVLLLLGREVAMALRP
jgi:hypothetical protein